jgi:hypothetical protein
LHLCTQFQEPEQGRYILESFSLGLEAALSLNSAFPKGTGFGKVTLEEVIKEFKKQLGALKT